MKWIISNHKEGLINETYQTEIMNLLDEKIRLIICPNDSQLLQFKDESYTLGSQDVDYSYSIDELKELAVKYTIVGHSDKRKKYNQTNHDINNKIKKLLTYNICPILCIGEEEEKSNVKQVIDIELEECLKDIKTDNIIIAYEPIWAIGSGKIPNEQKLQTIIEYIKEKTYELINIKPIVVYGGSVNENTIHLLEKVETLDGYLIGSASLDINKLRSLIEVIK